MLSNDTSSSNSVKKDSGRLCIYWEQVTCLTFLVLSFATYIRGVGILDDYEPVTSQNIATGSIIGTLLLFSMLTAFLIFLLLIWKNSSRLMFSSLAQVAITLGLVFCLVTLVYANVSLSNIKSNTLKSSIVGANTGEEASKYVGLNPITLENLEGLNNEHFTGIVLVERTSCPLCVELLPDIEKCIIDNELRVLHYNSENDRYDRREYVLSVMDQYEIIGVPVILIFDNGKVAKTHKGENIIEGLKEI